MKSWTLSPGSNIVIYEGGSSKPSSSIFDRYIDKIDGVWHQEGDTWHSYVPGNHDPNVSTLQTIYPGYNLDIRVKSTAGQFILVYEGKDISPIVLLVAGVIGGALIVLVSTYRKKQP